MAREKKRKIDAIIKPRRKALQNDEVISSDDEGDIENKKEKTVHSDHEEEEDTETAQEKRYRLAQEFLQQLEKRDLEKAEAANIDHDAIAHRIKEDLPSKFVRPTRQLADKLLDPKSSSRKVLKGHRLSPTCVVTSRDGKKCVSGSKDGSIIVWNLETGRKIKYLKGLTKQDPSTSKGHRGAVFCLALSESGKFMCSGGSDGLVHVWNFESMEIIKDFTGHKGAVTGLTFRLGHHELFSCGEDRSVKVWNLDEMGYVDTMFGHYDSISGIDSLARERAITCGGRDRSIRIWKIMEESQLVFNAHASCGSIECLSLINEDHFVSGSDDGSISVWSVMKKKPVCLVESAHSLPGQNSEQCWISSICSAKFTDLIASGSRDGCVKFWKCSGNYKSLDLLYSIPVVGFINGLCFTPDGRKLLCAVGQEHKSGRWWSEKKAKNSILVIDLEFNA